MMFCLFTHQTAGRSFCRPIVPSYYIEDCRILHYRSRKSDQILILNHMFINWANCPPTYLFRTTLLLRQIEYLPFKRCCLYFLTTVPKSRRKIWIQLQKEIQPNLHSHNFRVAVDRVVYVFGKGSILVILQNQETCIMQLFVIVLNIVLLS